MLGLDPDLPAGRLRVRPRIPDAIGHLRLRGVRLGAERVDITADGEGIAVTGTDLVVEIG
jgi:hypothetical protein